MPPTVTADPRNESADGELERTSWSRAYKITAVLAGLAVVVDGFDNQLLALVIPFFARELNVTPAAFAPALSAGLFGMMVGNALGGLVGDRWGRKPALVGSMAVFGLTNLAIAFVSSLDLVLLCRAVGGSGLGVTVPNAAVLAAETTPKARRTLAVTLVILGSPLGGILAGLAAGGITATETSWRWLFIIGGGLPLVLVPVAWLLIVESPHFARGAPAVEASPAAAKRRPPARLLEALFGHGQRLATLLIWAASFTNMLGLYSLLSWLPTLITRAGYAPALAGVSISLFNTGGMAGALIAAPIMARLGGRAVLAAMAGSACALTVLLIAVPLGPSFPVPLLLGYFAMLGVFAGGFNGALIPYVLTFYPAAARTSGVGAMLAIGRIGAAVSPFISVAALTTGGPPGFFLVYAVVMAGCALVIAVARPLTPSPVTHGSNQQ